MRKSAGWPSLSVGEWFPWLWVEMLPAAAGRLFTIVRLVGCPVGRRIVGPGKIPLKVHIFVGWPGKIGTSVSAATNVTVGAVRTGGIWSGAVSALSGAANASGPGLIARSAMEGCPWSNWTIVGASPADRATSV